MPQSGRRPQHHSRRVDRAPFTSGLPRLADILRVGWLVSNVPEADVSGFPKLNYGHHRDRIGPLFMLRRPSELIALFGALFNSVLGNAELRKSLQENRTAQVWIHQIVGIRLLYTQKN